MVSDARAMLARELHRKVTVATARLNSNRTQRNDLIRELRKEDPARWSYSALAKAVGCSPELIAAIVQGRST